MSHLSTNQLAEISEITKRQIQRLLDKGVPGLGATKTEGGHWIIPNTPEVRRWAKNHRRWKRVTSKRGKLNPTDKSTAIVTIEGIAQQFVMWHRKTDARRDLWDADQIDKAIALLEPQARLYAELVAKRDA